MTIHALAIAHYYIADKIVRGMTDDQTLKDIVKEASNQLKLGYCKAKYLQSWCGGISELPFKDKKPVVEFSLAFNNYLVGIFGFHHSLVQLQFPLSEKKAYEMATKMAV